MSTTVVDVEPCETHWVSCCGTCRHGLLPVSQRTTRGVRDAGFQNVMAQIATALGATVAEITGKDGCQLKLPLEVIGGALGLDTEMAKSKLAAAICRCAGIEWNERDDSTWSPSGGGETITVSGWRKVHRSLVLLQV